MSQDKNSSAADAPQGTEDVLKSLTERLAALEKKNASLEKSYADLHKENAALKKQLEANIPKALEVKNEKPLELPKQHFQVGDKKYRFISKKFTFKGQQLTAVDAINDPSILLALVEKKAGVIREVIGK